MKNGEAVNKWWTRRALILKIKKTNVSETQLEKRTLKTGQTQNIEKKGKQRATASKKLNEDSCNGGRTGIKTDGLRNVTFQDNAMGITIL